MSPEINLADPATLARLRGAVVDVCAGTVFVVVGCAAWGIAYVRRKVRARIFIWLGFWSAMYGLNVMWSPLRPILPHWMQTAAPFFSTATWYLVLPFGSLSWMETTRGWMRKFSAGLVVVELAIAAMGYAIFLMTGNAQRLLVENNLTAAFGLVVLLAVVCSPTLFAKVSVLPSRGFFAIAAFVFTLEALWSNISNPLGRPVPQIFEHLGFGLLLVAFAHSAMQMVLRNEQKLMTIESELEVARQIQFSILPRAVPRLDQLTIAAAYEPMAAVAGDFYEFIPRDEKHAGFLVADVCGHGVPAALIASMLKVAVQSAADSAENPAEFLRELNRSLAGPLQGKLVSAAYLWADMERRVARYSAAGHPPLLRWHDREMEAVESNGLLFGVLANAEYPVREIALERGDRLLLYTDGVTEAENAQGEAFGGTRLGKLLREKVSSAGIVEELRHWNGAQQDDATLILMDVG